MSRIAKSVTIPGIERATAVVGVAVTAGVYFFAGSAAAMGVLAGSGFMIVNFFLLALVGHGIVAMGRASGRLSILGILLIPLKLAFFIGVSYLLVSRLQVEVGAFVAGVLTQPAAILIEVWRNSPRVASIARPEIKGNEV